MNVCVCAYVRAYMCNEIKLQKCSITYYVGFIVTVSII